MEVEHEKRIKPSTTVASTRPEMVFKVESVDCSFDTESSVESKHDLKADDADFKDKTGVKSKELELDIIKDLTKTDDGATKANNSEFVKLEGAFAASKNTDVRDQAPKETADSNEASGTIDMPGATDVVKIDALIAKRHNESAAATESIKDKLELSRKSAVDNTATQKETVVDEMRKNDSGTPSLETRATGIDIVEPKSRILLNVPLPETVESSTTDEANEGPSDQASVGPDTPVVDKEATESAMAEIATVQLEQMFQVDTQSIDAVALLIGRFENVAQRQAQEVAHSRTSFQPSSVKSRHPQFGNKPCQKVCDATTKRMDTKEKAREPAETLGLKDTTQEKLETTKEGENRDMTWKGMMREAKVMTQKEVADLEESNYLNVAEQPRVAENEAKQSKFGDKEMNSANKRANEAEAEREETVEEERTDDINAITTEAFVETSAASFEPELAINQTRSAERSKDINIVNDLCNVPVLTPPEYPKMSDKRRSEAINVTTTMANTDCNTSEVLKVKALDNMNENATTNQARDELFTASNGTPQARNELLVRGQYHKSPTSLPFECSPERTDDVAVASTQSAHSTKSMVTDASGGDEADDCEPKQLLLSQDHVKYEILGVTRVNGIVMYHIYAFQSVTSEQPMSTAKRYSQFISLAEQLRALKVPAARDLPKLPKCTVGTFLRGRRNKKTIEHRQIAFEAFLHYVAQHQELHECVIFHQFITT